VVLELDAKKVGQEIRKRGLSSAISHGREGGMDRVSVYDRGVLTVRILSLDCCILWDLDTRLNVICGSSLPLPNLLTLVYYQKRSLPYSSEEIFLEREMWSLM